jgi:broad specificity phosphatase PhoE
MKLYFIRHGETVDNVAGLYAGTRDSTLTNHGVEQTERLGDYLARNGVKFTHVFTSPLSRAYKTAEAVVTAQAKAAAAEEAWSRLDLSIVKVPEIIERDFGYYEGKPFSSRMGSKSYTGDGNNDKAKSQPGFVDVESEESMARRIDSFLDDRLFPLFANDTKSRECIVAIVSHGMLLSHFWRRLLLRLPRKSLTIASDITAGRDNILLDHIGGWSNTGYMELAIRKGYNPDIKSNAKADNAADASAAVDATTLPTPVPPSLSLEEADVSVAPTKSNEMSMGSRATLRTLIGWSTTILAIDSKTHLLGLKRQRGGIGSLAHDEGQRKLDAFFKRPKLT